MCLTQGSAEEGLSRPHRRETQPRTRLPGLALESHPWNPRSEIACQWGALGQQQGRELGGCLPLFSQEDRQRDLGCLGAAGEASAGQVRLPTAVGGGRVPPWAHCGKGRVSLLLGLLASGPVNTQQTVLVLERVLLPPVRTEVKGICGWR